MARLHKRILLRRMNVRRTQHRIVVQTRYDLLQIIKTSSHQISELPAALVSVRIYGNHKKNTPPLEEIIFRPVLRKYLGRIYM